MLVTRNLQPSLWESVLPQEVRRLSPLLEQVDRWLEVDHSPGFRDLIKRRTGSEGRISHLKRRYGWNRSLVDGHEARTA
jgi:hypothetical protein